LVEEFHTKVVLGEALKKMQGENPPRKPRKSKKKCKGDSRPNDGETPFGKTGRKKTGERLQKGTIPEPPEEHRPIPPKPLGRETKERFADRKLTGNTKKKARQPS